MFKFTKYHLYFILTLIFTACFLWLNLKYDRYYRLPGITNESRLLIDEYLTDDEKKYLIENCIDVDLFINYIQEPHFKLGYCDYYRQVPGNGGFKTLDEMVSIVNEILVLLDENPQKDEIFAGMVRGNLLHDFDLYEDFFHFEDVDLYGIAKKYNEDEDLVIRMNSIIQELNECGYTREEIVDILPQLVEGYSLDTVMELVAYKIHHPEYQFVLNPSSKTIVLQDDDYLGSYKPKDLVRCEEAILMFYEIYLRKDAYEHYLNMLNDYMATKEGEQLLLVSGYKSQEVLFSENKQVDEAQLGTSIHVKAYGIYDNAFDESYAKKWLDLHAHEYGYILRYPEDGKYHKPESYTYRYVGKKTAKVIHDQHLTLEEYQESEIADE